MAQYVGPAHAAPPLPKIEDNRISLANVGNATGHGGSGHGGSSHGGSSHGGSSTSHGGVSNGGHGSSQNDNSTKVLFQDSNQNGYYPHRSCERPSNYMARFFNPLCDTNRVGALSSMAAGMRPNLMEPSIINATQAHLYSQAQRFWSQSGRAAAGGAVDEQKDIVTGVLLPPQAGAISQRFDESPLQISAPISLHIPAGPAPANVPLPSVDPKQERQGRSRMEGSDGSARKRE